VIDTVGIGKKPKQGEYVKNGDLGIPKSNLVDADSMPSALTVEGSRGVESALPEILAMTRANNLLSLLRSNRYLYR